MRRDLLIAAIVVATISAVVCLRAFLHSGGGGGEMVTAGSEGHSRTALENLSLTVVYDNYPCVEGLETAWGFSCFIDGTDKSILFDTGGTGSILLANMESLSINPEDIDIVVLSHEHDDHTGGLMALLEKNPDVVIYGPQSFHADFKRQVRERGTRLVDVGPPVEICESVYSVGQMGSRIKEQSLVVHTDEGLIVITGCAHPGIVSIVKKATELIPDDVLLAMGGFHLFRETGHRIQGVITDLKRAGVIYVGPCHCSGNNARHLFEEEYGGRYIEIGVGRTLASGDLSET